MSVKQISVFIENRPGSLAALAGVLRDNNIDIRALSIADVENYGILRIIVDNVYQAGSVLKKAEYVFKITSVLAVPLKDQAGSLAEALEALGKSDINVEYLYAFVGRQQNRAYVIFRVPDAESDKAVQALTANGFIPINQDELMQDGTAVS